MISKSPFKFFRNIYVHSKSKTVKLGLLDPFGTWMLIGYTEIHNEEPIAHRRLVVVGRLINSGMS